MEFNDDLFFREATLRICGTLEIDQALHRCFNYIKDFIPAEMISLQVFFSESETLETVAVAGQEGGKSPAIATKIPEFLRQIAFERTNAPRPAPEVQIANLVDDDEEMRWLRRHLDIPPSSALLMMLILDSATVGGLFVTKRGENNHTEEHARRLLLLNEPVAISLTNYLRYREVLELKNMLADDTRYLRKELQRLSGDDIVGADFGLRRVMEMVRQVAPLESPVLLLGETGTGKEVLAAAIHKASPRKDEPFITVNCGAIPENLMDSELFGHEKGAFTGALYQQRGRFERAHGGTLFLDEIGELSQDAQIRLLRVLQERVIERVGGRAPIKVDIRIIAATHRNLEAMLAERTFREDLYFRLRVFPINVPPLRERASDIPALVDYFIRKKTREMGLAGTPMVSPEAIKRLTEYQWPGNVRELEHAVERALILSQDQILVFDFIQHPAPVQETALNKPEEKIVMELDEVLRRHLVSALQMAGGRINGPGGAAELLNINPSTLRQKLRKLGIPFGRRAKGV